MSGWSARLLRAASKYWKDVQALGPQSERMLFDFRGAGPEAIAAWEVFSDSEMGGKSTASLSSSECGGAATFSGVFSTEIGRDAPLSLRRSGFAGMSSKVEATVEGGVDLDLEDFDTLILRVKGDGRPYIASLREDSWVINRGRHDMWQAFVFAKPHEWQEVEVPLNRFVLTHKGRMVENKHYMSKHRIISIGISLAGGSMHQTEGPFSLDIEWVKAVNLHDDRYDELEEDNPGPGSWDRRP